MMKLVDQVFDSIFADKMDSDDNTIDSYDYRDAIK